MYVPYHVDRLAEKCSAVNRMLGAQCVAKMGFVINLHIYSLCILRMRRTVASVYIIL